MLLTRRQTALYTDRAVLFVNPGAEVVIDKRTGEPLVFPSKQPGNPMVGEPGSPMVPLPCKFIYTENVDDSTFVGRIKRFNMDTADYCHFAAGAPVTNAVWVVNITRTLSGTGIRNLNFGQVSRVLGAPRVITGAGRRSVNIAVVRLMQEEQVPAHIADYLARQKI